MFPWTGQLKNRDRGLSKIEYYRTRRRRVLKRIGGSAHYLFERRFLERENQETAELDWKALRRDGLVRNLEQEGEEG